MRIVKLTESQLKQVVSSVIKENEMTENYMFFGNLQQIHRQCEMLLKMDMIGRMTTFLKRKITWTKFSISL